MKRPLSIVFIALIAIACSTTVMSEGVLMEVSILHPETDAIHESPPETGEGIYEAGSINFRDGINNALQFIRAWNQLANGHHLNVRKAPDSD